jgi:hypothetical protein
MCVRFCLHSQLLRVRAFVNNSLATAILKFSGAVVVKIDQRDKLQNISHIDNSPVSGVFYILNSILKSESLAKFALCIPMVFLTM